MTRYHVFGDTGGHYKQLKEGLTAIGYDPLTHKLPEDVVVIHCGDLLHKGPNSAGVIFMVDNIMKNNPNQWIQLLGNHEYQYLNGIPFWREKIDPDAIRTLQSWYEEGRAFNAFAITEPAVFHGLAVSKRGYATPDKPIIFTHAGITRQYWQKYLHSSQDVARIVKTLNRFNPETVGTPGAIVGGTHTAAYPAGPIWALGVDEVWNSWQAEPSMPFIQVHGHTAPFKFDVEQWWSNGLETKAKVKFWNASTVNPDRRTVVTEVSDSIQVAIDPGYEKTAVAEPQPALLITTQ